METCTRPFFIFTPPAFLHHAAAARRSNKSELGSKERKRGGQRKRVSALTLREASKTGRVVADEGGNLIHWKTRGPKGKGELEFEARTELELEKQRNTTAECHFLSVGHNFLGRPESHLVMMMA